MYSSSLLPSSYLLLVVRLGAPFVASERSVRSDARSPVRSLLELDLRNGTEDMAFSRTDAVMAFYLVVTRRKAAEAKRRQCFLDVFFASK